MGAEPAQEPPEGVGEPVAGFRAHVYDVHVKPKGTLEIKLHVRKDDMWQGLGLSRFVGDHVMWFEAAEYSDGGGDDDDWDEILRKF